ncbi:helix-turn-helix domain-containing protein [Streptomonospora salina]|uniref:Transcriptional regulator with XRE-family HTH domain n=1 Tax=Streptomonospora salina TaxID=104205 RepID=A0A841EBM2_9ACTN|nr:helix-turn-helix transcriptional regulator [Streptomonospora salina]MBB6000386.1 transcriptional regulator with XRE-family HTH domain [Streptomonospora salina]
MKANGLKENLAKLRELAGLTQKQLATRVGASASSVSRWESGTVAPKRGDVERLDETLNAGGQLMREWEREASGSQLPPWMRDTVRLEQEATSIDYVSPVLVPGLLQSPSYSAIVIAGAQPITDQGTIDRLVRLRCRRYAELRNYNNPRVSAVFPHTALTAFPECVRKEQTGQLVEMCESGRLSVHLVPEGAFLWGVTSPMALYRLRGGGVTASSDHMSGNFLHGGADDWERLGEVAKHAFAAALPSDQSRKLLEDLT